MKSVLILLFLSSLLLAWFAGKASEAKSEQDFLARLSGFCERHKVRARHKYDYELVKQRILMKSRREPFGPRWVRSLFGENVFSRIHELELSAADFEIIPPPSDEVEKDFKALDLKSLRFLKRLQFSGFRMDGATDGYSDVMQGVLKAEARIKLAKARRKLSMNLSLISDLRALEHLEIDTWSRLKSLDGVEQLSQLKTIVGGSGMDSLVDVEALKELQNLEMIKLAVGSDFASYKNWDALSSKRNLIELSVRNANRSSVNDVGPAATSSFAPSPQLEILGFDRVDPGLENLHCCKDMPGLRSLRVVGSPTLKSLEGIGYCQGLTHLVIHDCPNLEDVKEIEQLQNLQVLSISSSQNLSIPVLQCRDIKVVALREVDGFDDLRFLKNAQNLRTLDVSNSGLKSLKGLSRLSFLSQLLAGGSRLGSIGCERKVVAPLQHVDLSFCKNLTDLNGLEFCNTVKIIDLKGCTRLDNLQGLGEMRSLENLDLSGCTAIESLDDLVAVPDLTEVVVNRCSNLTDVSALLKLVQLKIFRCEDCPGLDGAKLDAILDKFPYLNPPVRGAGAALFSY